MKSLLEVLNNSQTKLTHHMNVFWVSCYIPMGHQRAEKASIVKIIQIFRIFGNLINVTYCWMTLKEDNCFYLHSGIYSSLVLLNSAVKISLLSSFPLSSLDWKSVQLNREKMVFWTEFYSLWAKYGLLWNLIKIRTRNIYKESDCTSFWKNWVWSFDTKKY